MTKVLFIAAGRRVSLAERFIKEGFQIFSYETETDCPISTVAGIIKGKKWTDPNIEDHLYDIITSLDFDLVIPLADQATSILSKLIEKDQTLKNKIPTSSQKTNNICLNKRLFEQTFLGECFYPDIDKNYDVILKPIFGANSKGIKTVSYNEYANYHMRINQDLVGQRFIKGNLEISVDAYFNKQSQMIDAVPRQRLEIQGGEVNRSMTLEKNSFGIVDIVRKIGEKIKLVGPTCIQFIIENDKPYIMEINARFGGGVILSLESGCNMVNLIKQEYIENKIISPLEYKSKWKSNKYMTRYFMEYFYE